jgi:hypothetical protein
VTNTPGPILTHYASGSARDRQRKQAGAKLASLDQVGIVCVPIKSWDLVGEDVLVDVLLNRYEQIDESHVCDVRQLPVIVIGMFTLFDVERVTKVLVLSAE